MGGIVSEKDVELFKKALAAGLSYKKRIRTNGNIVIKFKPNRFSVFKKRLELSYYQAQELGIADPHKE